jgi:hypothetical protein
MMFPAYPAPLVSLAQQNPAIGIQMLHTMLSAGAHGAARSAWIEINRPLTALALNNPLLGAFTANQAGSPQNYAGGGVTAGAVLSLVTISLPIGMDIKSVTCIAADVDAGWQVLNFTFGTLNLVNPQGSFGGVNLSMFDPRLEHEDRLAPWILSKTKVDVQVTAQLQNGTFYANFPAAPAGQNNVFHGFSLNAFQEEQVCAIQTRIEPTDRNVGNAELIAHFRATVGQGLGLNLPSFVQAPSQIGRVATMMPHIPQFLPQPMMPQVPVMAPIMPQIRVAAPPQMMAPRPIYSPSPFS